MYDPTSRLRKIGDALSQLWNVSTAWDHTSTTANESVSGRSYRMGFRRRMAFIDAILGAGHCAESYHRDVERARETIIDAMERGHDA